MSRQWCNVLATAALSVGALFGTALAADAYDSTICGETAKYNSPDGQYIYGSNAWNPVGDGYQCLSITNDPVAMDATWMWDADPTDVHSFPHVRFNSEFLPTRMSSIRSLQASVQWAMYVSENVSEPPRSFSAQSWAGMKSELKNRGVVANVAWDFFADPNKTRTYNPVDADTEIMIWLGRLGGAQPLMGDSPLTTMNLSGVTFELYHAKNFREHNVFTWLPVDDSDVTDFEGDLAPMLEYVRTSGLIDEDSWLGLAEIGSETWYSAVNITFTATNYKLTVDNGNDETSGGGGGSGDGGDGEDAGGRLAIGFGTMVCAMLISFLVWL